MGSVTTPPYNAQISLRGLEPGHYMLTAVAFDDLGSSIRSSPVHISVGMLHH